MTDDEIPDRNEEEAFGTLSVLQASLPLHSVINTGYACSWKQT